MATATVKSYAELLKALFDGGEYWVQSAAQSYSIQKIGTAALRFEVRAGDVWSAVDPVTVNRAEIASTVQIANGTPIHVDYIMNVDPGAANTAAWTVLGQFHQNNASGSPPFAIGLVGEKMTVTIGLPGADGKTIYRTVFTDSTDMQRGHDYSFQIEIKFDPKGNGHVVVVRDGYTIVDYAGKLGLIEQSTVYWKEGIYRAESSTTMAVTYTDLDVTTRDAEVTASTLSTDPISVNQYSNKGVLISNTTEYANGETVMKEFAPDGSVTHLKAAHADRSYDSYDYGVTGQAYSSVHSVVNSSGKVVLVERFHADGTLEFKQVGNADGTTWQGAYDSAGKIVQTVQTLLNGGKETIQYGITGKAFTTIDSIYDSAGKLVSEAHLRSDNSIVTKEVFYSNGASMLSTYDSAGKSLVSTLYKASDGSSEILNYVSGKTYAVEKIDYDASGKVTYLEHTRSDGKIEWTQTFGTNGVQHYYVYNASGGVDLHSITRADGSRENDTFNILNKTYSSTVELYDTSNKLISLNRFHIDGTKEYSQSYRSDGSVVYSKFDASGKLSVSTTAQVDGSRAIFSYDTSGKLTNYVEFDASSQLKRVETTYTDGSRRIEHYGITGQTYTYDKVLYDASGKQTFLTRYHADGTLDFRQFTTSGGAVERDSYNASGFMTVKTVTFADGSKDSTEYLVSGRDYVSGTYHYNAAGIMTHSEQKLLDGGKRVGDYGLTGDYAKKVVYFDASGHEKQEMLYAADGKLTYMDLYATDGSHTETFYGGGVATKSIIHKIDGSIVAKAFASAMTLVSGTGNDTFTSFQSDTFVFKANSGSDTILNFHTGANHDTILIDKLVADEFGDLHMTQNGADVVIDLSASDHITLKSVSLANLSGEHFLFA